MQKTQPDKKRKIREEVLNKEYSKIKSRLGSHIL